MEENQEENQIIYQDEHSEQENDIALEEKRIPSPEQEKNATKISKDTEHIMTGEHSQQEKDYVVEGKRIPSPEQEKNSLDTVHHKIGKNSVAKSPRNKPQGNQSLVLQMYSHLRIQRQLEEEKNSKIALLNRRRQHIKRELAASCPPVGSSLKSFGSSWTQFRVLRGPQGKLQEETTQNNSTQAKEIPNSPQPTDSNQVPGGDQDKRCDRLEVNGGPCVVRSQSIGHGREVRQSDGGMYNEAVGDSPGRFHHQIQHRPRQPPGRSQQRSPHPQRQNNNASNCVSTINHDNNDSHQSRNRGRIANPNSNMATHVLKGPGRIQIRFSARSAPGGSSTHAARGHKHNSYQWDSMPAGTLTSVQPSLITLDGSIL